LGPTYEDEVISVEEIVNNDLLFLHEVIETCVLKSLGYSIDKDTVMRAYPDTYYAHLKAIEIELIEANNRDNRVHIEKRCMDLRTYLDDPYLSKNL